MEAQSPRDRYVAPFLRFFNRPSRLLFVPPYLILFLLGISMATSVSADQQLFEIAPIPEWVRPLPLNELNADRAAGRGGRSVEYLLLDRQWDMRSGTQRQFHRILSRAETATGVEEAAHVAIDFDPSYETLILHKLVVHRDGEELDRMARSRKDVIQREQQLNYRIYNGSKTLNIFIDDVRRGDIIEYSYTLSGINPVLGGHFAKVLRLQWSVPLENYHYRLLWPADKNLYIRKYKTSVMPSYEQTGEHEEYVWRSSHVDALLSDGNTPDWFDPFPAVHLSDMGSWADVVQWALPLYAANSVHPAVQKLATELSAAVETPEQRLIAALRFVQEEVRYLGIEMGPRSHQPNPPEVVLEQRFGDCKDKSRLLVALLTEMGIEAYPALVHSSSGRRLLGWAPTPLAFDHVIVHAVVGGKSYWIDPTRSYQAGDLATLYQPNYEFALVISPTNSELVSITDDIQGRHTKIVDEEIDLRDDRSRAARYTINTQYDRYYADHYREQLAEKDHNRIQQEYVDYTAQYYQGATSDELFTVDDDRRRNRLILTERYRLPQIWEDGDNGKLTAEFVPFLINDHVVDVDSLNRSMPYALPHPVSIRHTTRVQLSPGGTFEDEQQVIEDPVFRFVKTVRFEHNTLILDYRYDSLRDHVLPQDIASFSEHVKAVRRLAYYQIEKPKPLPIELERAATKAEADQRRWQATTQTVFSILKAVGL